MKHKGQKSKSKALIEDLSMNKFYLIDNQRESEGRGSLVCYTAHGVTKSRTKLSD